MTGTRFSPGLADSEPNLIRYRGSVYGLQEELKIEP